VATFGRCTEEGHDRAPFAPVGGNLESEQAEGHQVRRFVRNRLGKERLGTALQQVCIVTDQAIASVRDTYLSGAGPAQIEADARHCELGIEMPRRQITQPGG